VGAPIFYRDVPLMPPDMVKVMVNLGATLASEGHMAEAAIQIDKALALAPSNKEAVNLRSMIESALDSKPGRPESTHQ